VTHPVSPTGQAGVSPVLPLLGSRICVVEIVLWTGIVPADATLAANASIDAVKATARAMIREARWEHADSSSRPRATGLGRPTG
jgi:hypothetical protein